MYKSHFVYLQGCKTQLMPSSGIPSVQNADWSGVGGSGQAALAST